MKLQNHHIKTYKIVGDNLDLNVRPRFMRVNKHHPKSLHLFHSYAVADRINMSGFTDDPEHTFAIS